MAQATVTALPLGRPDDESLLNLPGGVHVTLLRWGCRVFTVADRGTSRERLLT